jgi:5-(carboxyamino)imidazole ribonucleotide synthase
MSTSVTTTTTRAACARTGSGGAVVAMVGAGQLARMTQQAAISLGVQLRVMAVGDRDAAVRAGAEHRIGSPDSVEDLRALASGADVVTFDHEGVAPEHLAALELDGVILAPSAGAKRFAQDKLHARRTLTELGFPTPAFTHARTESDADAFAAAHGWPLIAKIPRGGYDGRGVFPITDLEEARRALEQHPDGLLLEPRLALDRELAVLVARSRTGETVGYPVVETIQQDGMCREIHAPAPVAPSLAAQASDLAVAIAERIDATGILAVELFHTAGELLVNELALRPHNSGHYTIEGCATSQFEQHLRAVLGWPLGSPSLVAPAVVTVNVIGPVDGSDPATRVAPALSVRGAHLHLYGKDARPGRKLGHVTVCGEELQPVRRAARLAADILEGTAA